MGARQQRGHDREPQQSTPIHPRLCSHEDTMNNQLPTLEHLDRTILSLCDYTGSWSQPYEDAGYHVVRVDLKHGQDVRFLELPYYPIHGILAAPPCTVFASSGARWPRTEQEMLEGLSVVDACLRFVAVCKPQWWALENPVGTLTRYLGPPKLWFNPCDYGDPYTKRTGLWGEFAIPTPCPVAPLLGSKMHVAYGGKSDRTKTARSTTPAGFAHAFFLANP